MVRYFVVPQKDEAFYSLIARFQDHTGMNGYHLSRNLFGRPSITHHIMLPSYLTDFCERVGKDVSLPYETISKEYTLLPLYEKFNNTIKQHAPMARPSKFLSQKITQQIFRYCTCCFEEDYDSKGEPYWNRTHNIPNVQVCLDHNVILEEWIPNFTMNFQTLMFPASIVNAKQDAKRVTNSLAKDLATQTIRYLKTDDQPNFDEIIELAKSTGLLIRKGPGFAFNNSNNTSINKFVNEAALESGQHALDIVKNIRVFLARPKPTIDPYSFAALDTYLKSLPKKKNFDKIKQIRKYDQSLLALNKSIWEEELNSKDFVSITISRAKIPATYRFLQRNHSHWLVPLNKPKRVKKIKRKIYIPKFSKSDSQIVRDILSKKDSLIKDGIDRRVSKSLIVRLAEFKFLNRKNLKFLPESENILRTKLESEFDFKKRMITKFMNDNQDNLLPKGKIVDRFRIKRGNFSNHERASFIEIINRYY